MTETERSVLGRVLGCALIALVLSVVGAICFLPSSTGWVFVRAGAIAFVAIVCIWIWVYVTAFTETLHR